MGKPKLIYCANGNPRFQAIAIAHGFLPGAQLPGTVYTKPLYFADQNWKRPRRAAYMAALAKHRPTMATVLDWEREDQFPEVMDWAEEAAQYVEYVVIIPKVAGTIPRIPKRINGATTVLGYSVPTRYAGTTVPPEEFAGWPLHLLGGSPHKQMAYWETFRTVADVISVDGNYMMRMATRHCQYWCPPSGDQRARFVPLRREDGSPWGKDAPYEAFRRSCVAIVEAWNCLTNDE